jgi:DNA-binding PadR family transcriptional regulator
MDDAHLTMTEVVVLGLVAFGERSGYDLARLAEESVGYLWTPSRSQIYKVLPRLVSKGLARVRTVRQRDRPDKALYRITPAGRRALRAWLEQVDDESSGDTRVFALKLFFCDLVPVRVAHAQLDGYRRFLEGRLRRFESMRQDLAEAEYLFPQLVLRRAIARIRATLLWLDEAKAAMQTRRERLEAAARPDTSTQDDSLPTRRSSRWDPEEENRQDFP